MSDIAIRVENLGKRYRIGAARERYDTLRDALVGTFRRLRRRSLEDAEEREIWALKDVSFEVKRGEVLGIIGRNGAGKSTLLKILSRITEPTTGRAEIYGRVGSLLEVGTGFHPELTGRENIYLSGAILGMKKAEIDRRFDEIVEFAEIERFLDTPVKRYSSGMYVRLAFAVAAHLDPEILLVDEVLAVGDAAFQKKCLGKMGEVGKEGRTVLFVSHNMAAIETLCDRGLLLHKGFIQALGPIEQIISEYTWKIESELPPMENHSLYGAPSKIHLIMQGNRNIHIKCGDPLVIKFFVYSSSPLEQISTGITLCDAFEAPIVGMSSKVQGVSPFSRPSKRWLIECDLGRIPLNAGLYLGRVYVGDGIMDLAVFHRAFSVTISEYDVFGWGNSLPPLKSWGPFFWAPRWDIRPGEDDGQDGTEAR